MKKFIIAIAMLFGFISSASAAGVNIGISLTAGQFEADGAAEKFTGAHGGSAVPSPGNVTKKALMKVIQQKHFLHSHQSSSKKL